MVPRSPPGVVKSEDLHEIVGPEGLHSDHLAMPKSPPGEEAAFSDEEEEVSTGQC